MAINLLIEVFCTDVFERIEYLHSREKIYEKAISDINQKNIINYEDMKEDNINKNAKLNLKLEKQIKKMNL